MNLLEGREDFDRERLADELLRLKDENEGLRRLVVDMCDHLREAERVHGDALLPDGYVTRMRELGMEVD